ncbi:hypothetical protein ACB092_11G087300 [Castanea dentata]
MRPFGEAKSISGHQTLQLMRKPYGGKRQSNDLRADFPPARGTGDGHLKAHHDLQARPVRRTYD